MEQDRTLQESTAVLVHRLTQRLAPASELLDRAPPERYARLFGAEEVPARYGHVPDAAREVVRELEESHGSEAVDLYHQLVLLTLIGEFEERFEASGLPPSVRPGILDSFGQIVAQIERGRAGYYQAASDSFHKDLAICRLRMVPCGAEVADRLSGVPRSVLLRGGPRQLPAALRFFTLETRGFAPFYELHLHRGHRREFTEEGYDRCYRLVAELLRAEPHVKGMVSTSWWFDPAVERISPELAFLARRPLRNGAARFRWVADEHVVADATRLSPTRRSLHEEGAYRPASYMIVWARRDLLAWADPGS